MSIPGAAHSGSIGDARLPSLFVTFKPRRAPWSSPNRAPSPAEHEPRAQVRAAEQNLERRQAENEHYDPGHHARRVDDRSIRCNRGDDRTAWWLDQLIWPAVNPWRGLDGLSHRHAIRPRAQYGQSGCSELAGVGRR
jgi:hypothetical protein